MAFLTFRSQSLKVEVSIGFSLLAGALWMRLPSLPARNCGRATPQRHSPRTIGVMKEGCMNQVIAPWLHSMEPKLDSPSLLTSPLLVTVPHMLHVSPFTGWTVTLTFRRFLAEHRVLKQAMSLGDYVSVVPAAGRDAAIQDAFFGIGFLYTSDSSEMMMARSLQDTIIGGLFLNA